MTPADPTRKKRKAPRTAWKPGQSGNPEGAPKRGESWAEIIKRVGDMTPEEAAEHAKAIAGKLKQIGKGVTLKEAVVIRIYAALLFEPTAGLWGSMMDRAEGKVREQILLDASLTIPELPAIIEKVYGKRDDHRD